MFKQGGFAVFFKAVNPNKKPVIDTRTPEELLDIIEQKGKEIAEALSILRAYDK